MNKKNQPIIVTYALPYANGQLHLGHMLGAVQTDIWTRTQRLTGTTCYFICGDDAHGTPIMLHAQKLEIAPEELIAKYLISHQSDFLDFNISTDNYYTTHSNENKELAEKIYLELKNNNLITVKNIKQAYDEAKQMFLPDRFIKGTCPKCKAEDQYGDSCEVCGSTYLPSELINPKSVLSDTTPIERDSEHYFFELPKLEDFLKKWTTDNHLQPEVAHKMAEWFEAGLKNWDISRDEPYFGFKIPGTENKYFYVWLDAPIGYIASFKNFCEKNNLKFADFWQENSNHQLIHFLGKDITYFHALFWPAMLHATKLKTPDKVYVHGFLTINGKKMSKSRGTFINARDYLEQAQPDYLRYYFAAKLNNKVEDFDLSTEDFVNRVNADLINKIVNIASRSAKFINKFFDNKLSNKLDNTGEELFKSFIAKKQKIIDLYLNREYSQAIKEIMALADLANQYIDNQKPWILAKDENTRDEVQNICTVSLNLFKILINYLTPVVPELAEKSYQFLNIKFDSWNDIDSKLLNHEIQEFKPLMNRLNLDDVKKIFDRSE